MDKDDIQQITAERLDGWGKMLVDAHATPAAVIGIGHDEVSGTLHLCITEDIPIATVRGFLAWIVRELDSGVYTEARPDV